MPSGNLARSVSYNARLELLCSNQGSDELKIESERSKVQASGLGFRIDVERLVSPLILNVSLQRRRFSDLILNTWSLIFLISNLNLRFPADLHILSK